jgi:hypothetical protein
VAPATCGAASATVLDMPETALPTTLKAPPITLPMAEVRSQKLTTSASAQVRRPWSTPSVFSHAPARRAAT